MKISKSMIDAAILAYHNHYWPNLGMTEHCWEPPGSALLAKMYKAMSGAIEQPEVVSVAPMRNSGMPLPAADVFIELMRAWRFADVGSPAESALKATIAAIDAKAVAWFGALDKCARLLEIEDDHPIIDAPKLLAEYINRTDKERDELKAQLAAPRLTVWCGSMPESNGKSNFTAILMRKGATLLDGLTGGITIARSEYPDRVRYEADCMRHLIGELPEEPWILDYDADKHSGYIEPSKD